MPNVHYLARMERVLAARVTHQRKARPFMAGRLGGIGTALLAAIACFFLLKGAMLAHLGAERYQVIAAPVAQGEGLPGLRYWLAGRDPVSGLLAEAIAPGRAPANEPVARTD